MTPPRIRIRDAGRRAVPPLLFTTIAIMVVTLAVLATSCPAARPTSYGTPSTTAGPAVAATTTPTIVNLSFQPGTIRVRVGAKVTWTNRCTVAETVTADHGAFDSVLQPGGTASFTFANRGTYAYHSRVHPFMHGKVVVG